MPNDFKPVTVEELLDTVYGSISNFASSNKSDEFVNYVLPSIPLTEDDTFFLDGDIPPDDGPERVDAFRKRRESAYSFANLVDFVPSITAKVLTTDKPTQISDDRVSFDEFTTKGYRVSQAYEIAIRDAKILDNTQSEQDVAKIDRLKARLYHPPVYDDDLEEFKPPVPTTLKNEYDTYQQLYEDKELAYLDELTDIDKDPANARVRAKLRGVLKKNLSNIEKDWEISGNKSTVKRIQNKLAALEQGGMANYRASLLDRMESMKFDNTLIADSMDFAYYTAITPRHLLKAESWTNLAITNSSEYNKFESKDKSFKAKVGPKIFGINAAFSGNYDKNTTVQSDASSKLTIGFEIAQALIERNWMDLAYLNTCRNWSLTDPATGDSTTVNGDFILSDGKKPPTGAMPAYVTSVILVRNLTIQSDGTKSINETLEESMGASGGTRFLGFSLSKVGGSTVEKEKLWEFDESKGKLTMLGTHIVAFCGAYLDKSPNPNFTDHPAPDDWI